VSAKTGSDQIVTQKHLARDLSVTRLIRANEGKMTKAVKIKDKDGEKKEDSATLGKR
jgi:arginine repressor